LQPPETNEIYALLQRLKHLMPGRADVLMKAVGPVPSLETFRVALDSESQETGPISVHSQSSSLPTPDEEEFAAMFAPRTPLSSPLLSSSPSSVRLFQEPGGKIDAALDEAGADAETLPDSGMDGEEASLTDLEHTSAAAESAELWGDAQPRSPLLAGLGIEAMPAAAGEAVTVAPTAQPPMDVGSAVAALPSNLLKTGAHINSNGDGHTAYLAFARECKTVGVSSRFCSNGILHPGPRLHSVT
jgi:hypothetical protein